MNIPHCRMGSRPSWTRSDHFKITGIPCYRTWQVGTPSNIIKVACFTVSVPIGLSSRTSSTLLVFVTHIGLRRGERRGRMREGIDSHVQPINNVLESPSPLAGTFHYCLWRTAQCSYTRRRGRCYQPALEWNTYSAKATEIQSKKNSVLVGYTYSYIAHTSPTRWRQNSSFANISRPNCVDLCQGRKEPFWQMKNFVVDSLESAKQQFEKWTVLTQHQ